MEYTEIKNLSDQALNEKLATEQAFLIKLKLQHSVSPIESPARITAQRKLVARLLTETSARTKTPVKTK